MEVLFKETVTKCVTQDGGDLPASRLPPSRNAECPTTAMCELEHKIDRSDNPCLMYEDNRQKGKARQEHKRRSDHLNPLRHNLQVPSDSAWG